MGVNVVYKKWYIKKKVDECEKVEVGLAPAEKCFSEK
jgi:hypothetical protein